MKKCSIQAYAIKQRIYKITRFRNFIFLIYHLFYRMTPMLKLTVLKHTLCRVENTSGMDRDGER